MLARGGRFVTATFGDDALLRIQSPEILGLTPS
jgi:hypothetical protein